MKFKFELLMYEPHSRWRGYFLSQPRVNYQLWNSFLDLATRNNRQKNDTAL